MRKAFFTNLFLFGLLAGLLCLGYFYVLYSNDAMPLGTRRNLGMVIIWLMMALALARYITSLNRTLHFLEGLGLCVGIILIASIIEGGGVVVFLIYYDTALMPNFIVELKRLALLDRATVLREFGSQKNGGMIDYDTFLQQIDQISLSSIFWVNFGLFRWLFHLLYASLAVVWFRRKSMEK